MSAPPCPPDIKVNVRVAVSLLKRCGVEAAAVCCNGAEAVEACDRQPIDLVFMDIQSAPPPGHPGHPARAPERLHGCEKDRSPPP